MIITSGGFSIGIQSNIRYKLSDIVNSNHTFPIHSMFVISHNKSNYPKIKLKGPKINILTNIMKLLIRLTKK